MYCMAVGGQVGGGGNRPNILPTKTIKEFENNDIGL